jgi:hypothetical protein
MDKDTTQKVQSASTEVAFPTERNLVRKMFNGP